MHYKSKWSTPLKDWLNVAFTNDSLKSSSTCKPPMRIPPKMLKNAQNASVHPLVMLKKCRHNLLSPIVATPSPLLLPTILVWDVAP